MTRFQPMMPRTHTALLEWLEHRAWMRERKGITEVKSDLVFGRLDGGPIRRIDTAWENVPADAGIKDLHVHDLRTVYATMLTYTGASLPMVGVAIGHKDERSTQRYIHIQTMRHLRPYQPVTPRLHVPGGI